MGTGLGVFWVCYEICTLLTNEQVLAVYYGWVLGGGEGGLYTTKRALVSKQQVLAVCFGWVLRCVWGGGGGFGCALFVLQNVHLLANSRSLQCILGGCSGVCGGGLEGLDAFCLFYKTCTW
jgi:hypothetical protein